MALRCLRVLVGGVFVLYAAGCGAPTESDPTEEETVLQTSDAIQGGYDDATDAATVGIYNYNYGALCTGSLLTPNMVLTARHCVSNILNDANGVNCSVTTAAAAWPANGFFVTTKAQLTQNPADYRGVVEVVTLPTDSKFCGQDEAILILDSNVPDTEAVPYVPRVDSALVKQEQYSAIGYGESSDGNQNSAGYRRRRDNLFVDCAETDCVGVDAYVKDSEWMGDTGICSGDSGGPALDLQNRVVGVTSRGGAGCTYPVYGSVHSWGDWIKQTALHAADLGGYDPPPWANGWPTDPSYNYPVGGACGECPICVNDQCSRFCSDAAPCPDGWACVDADGQGTMACKEQPKKTSSSSGGDGESGDSSCTVSDPGRGGADPTNPVPWFAAAFGLGGLATARRLRARKASKQGSRR